MKAFIIGTLRGELGHVSRSMYLERRPNDRIPTKLTWHVDWRAATRMTYEEAIAFMLLYVDANLERGFTSDVEICEVIGDRQRPVL